MLRKGDVPVGGDGARSVTPAAKCSMWCMVYIYSCRLHGRRKWPHSGAPEGLTAPGLGGSSSVVLPSSLLGIASPGACSSSSSSSSSSAVSLPASRALYFLRLFFILLARFFIFLSATAASRLESPLAISSRRAARRLRAIWRFWARERVAWDLTTMPVGMCLSWTAELVLFC